MNTERGSQFSASRGRCSPRSRIRIFLPVGARRWARVAPPAPLPTMMMSKVSAMGSPSSAQINPSLPGLSRPPISAGPDGAPQSPPTLADMGHRDKPGGDDHLHNLYFAEPLAIS